MVEKTEVLTALLRLAIEKWGCNETEKMRPAFERAARSIWKVMSISLPIEEEPAYSIPLLFQNIFSPKKGDQ